MGIEGKYDVAYHVYETDQYDDFSFLEENRDISYAHVAKLAESLKEGYEMPPLIVDEDLNVIDGQHRLKAHEQLQKPVRFIVQNQTKENALQKANTDVSKWTTAQHIQYHIKQGNEHYIKLQAYADYAEMPPGHAVRILGRSSDPSVRSTAKVIQYGLFIATYEEDAYAFADEVIMRVRMESPSTKIISAVKNLYDVGAETKRLVTAINVTEDEILLINTIPKIMETIAKVYNKDLQRADQIKFKEGQHNQLRPYI